MKKTEHIPRADKVETSWFQNFFLIFLIFIPIDTFRRRILKGAQ
jgi:hypothetical protein